MENINKILQKFFEGVSTLEEEKVLKNYFKSGKISEEHLPYQPLFQAFEEEAAVISPENEFNPTFRLSLSRFMYAASSVAAVVLLAFWLFGSPVVENDYAIVNGTKINNPEIAQEMAMQKLSRVNDIIGNNLQSLEKISSFKNELQPLERISKVKQEMDRIRLKINQEE
jgi:Na+/phosphate symporter